MQVVKTDKGYVSGTIIGEPGSPVSIFRGIPYAAPPIGPLRWRSPQPDKPWDGIRECTQYSAICPQMLMPGIPSSFAMSEDCLYLNVVTPAKTVHEKLPVMVWMHGGAYIMGGGNDAIWNNYRLPQYGVIVVTVTHRLGVFGMAAHPALSGEAENGVSGNYLFLDLIAALQWVQRNIASFGGDPGNVTIFGESGGGDKVSVMMSTPLAKGLFHRAICQSGTATAVVHEKPLKEQESYGVQLFKKLGVKTLEEARKAPWEKILEASHAMETPPLPGHALPTQVWNAVIDGWMLPDNPANMFKSGSINAVPFIACATLGEITGPGPVVMPQIISAYIDMMEALSKKNVKSYACIFDHIPARWWKEGGVSAHSIELPYVFGDWDNTTGWWRSIASFMQTAGAKTKEVILDSSDKSVSEAMMQLWTHFARTGKPAAKGLTDWPAYEKAGDMYLYLNERPQINADYSGLER